MRVVGIMDATRKSFCSHRVVDALVSMKVDVCKDAGIETEVDVRLSDDVPFSSVELCAVFSNLFGTMLSTHVKKVPEERRFITLRARLDAGHLVVRMENGCVASTGGKKRPLRQRAGLAEHGWGLDHPRDDGSAIRGKLSGAATRRRVLDDGDFEGGSGRGGRLQNAAVRARFRGATVKGAISYYVKLVSVQPCL